MAQENKRRSDSSGLLAVLGIGAAMVLCCAGPVLVAAGAAGVLGAALRSGWLILVTVGLVAAAVAWTVRWRRHLRGSGSSNGGLSAHSDDGSCCPPRTTESSRVTERRRSS
jgi:hypothetical protein